MFAGLLAGASPAQERRYDEILARHERSLGDAAGRRGKDLYAMRTCGPAAGCCGSAH